MVWILVIGHKIEQDQMGEFAVSRCWVSHELVLGINCLQLTLITYENTVIGTCINPCVVWELVNSFGKNGIRVCWEEEWE